MRNLLSHKYLLFFSQLILAVIFIFAGMEKIVDPSAFAKSIYNYKLFPEALINLFAVIIPWIEVISGVLLLFNVYTRENAFITGLLLAIFITLIVISIGRDLNIECGCFGTMSGSRVGWQKVAENAGLILLSLHIIFYKTDQKIQI